MAQTHFALRVEFEDLGLLQSTIDEYIAEVREFTARCYECGDRPCRPHALRIEELESNLDALALGMIRVPGC